ncbi:MAG TPA: transposase DNA-binding-containing protein [Ktedonobacteraceae bacterium]|nr:transposase DNA-binding-containing protein [Ktedonobacteraceae bacterium]
MEQEPLQQAEKWAVSTFGAAELGDPRRTDRLIKVASGLAANPSASLPHASETWGETNGAYRFLSDPAFSYEEILLPHWSQTYHEASQGSRTLLLADTTEFDFTTHQALKGRGPVGNSKENIGFSLHTVLAMDPQTQQILGCLTLEPFIRKLAPVGETKAQRKHRPRESQVWERSVQRIGRVPENCQWIYVGDSGSDVYTFWQTCEELGYDFVLRVAQDRDVEVPQQEDAERLDEAHLKTLARALAPADAHVVSIPAQHHQPKREALLQINSQPVRVQPPLHGARLRETEITAWVVRVWETSPPEGQEPLEWIELNHTADLLRRRRLGSGAMVWLALVAGGFPQGAQNGLPDGTPQSADHGSPVEAPRHSDSDCLAFVAHPTSRTASAGNACDCCGFSRGSPGRDPVGYPPPQYWDSQRIMARHCPSGRLSRPQERWTSRMADLMERMDARDGRLGRRSSCGSPPSFLISVEVIELKHGGFALGFL